MKTINRLLSIKPNIFVCTPFFQYATPVTQTLPSKIVLKGGLGIFFLKQKLLIECYRLNHILSFALFFFNKLPPGHRECPLKTVLKKSWEFFLRNENY